jgi:hypothetical protein
MVVTTIVTAATVKLFASGAVAGFLGKLGLDKLKKTKEPKKD